MRRDLLFETSRFNLSEVKAHFINPCCFGEDLAAWLRGRLAEKGLGVTEPDQEDWGWYIEVSYEGGSYFIGVGGNADEAGGDSDRGEWRIMVEKHRSLWDRLRGQNRASEADGMTALIREILEAEPAFRNVRYE